MRVFSSSQVTYGRDVSNAKADLASRDHASCMRRASREKGIATTGEVCCIQLICKLRHCHFKFEIVNGRIFQGLVPSYVPRLDM
jgi:hypothetical protein